MPNELDELYGMVTNEADKTALQQILARNPVAQECAEAQAALFAALATGDNQSIAAAQTRFAAASQPAATTASPAAASATLDELTRMVTSKVTEQFNSQFATKEADIRKQALADAKAEMQIEGGKLLAAAMSNSDAVYTVRRSHEKEFGTELDTGKFSEFLNANTGKFATLAAAHDSFVGEERVQRRIAQGIDEYKKTATSAQVPGTSTNLRESTDYRTPLPQMLNYNDKLTNPAGANGTPRGAALDAAVKAWRQTASGGNSSAN